MTPSHLERRAEKLHLILEVARSMAIERNLDHLLAMVLQAGAKVAEADRSSIFLVDRERGELWTRLAQGVDAGKEIRIPLGAEWNPRSAPIGVYAELAPGIGLAPGTFGFVEGGIGARFYFP